MHWTSSEEVNGLIDPAIKVSVQAMYSGIAGMGA